MVWRHRDRSSHLLTVNFSWVNWRAAFENCWKFKLMFKLIGIGKTRGHTWQLDNMEDCWTFFNEKVRRILKVVLCFSPNDATLRLRRRKFPNLINCFDEWPPGVMQWVSTRFPPYIPEHLVSTFMILNRKYKGVTASAIWPIVPNRSMGCWKCCERRKGTEISDYHSTIHLYTHYVHTITHTQAKRGEWDNRRYLLYDRIIFALGPPPNGARKNANVWIFAFIYYLLDDNETTGVLVRTLAHSCEFPWKKCLNVYDSESAFVSVTNGKPA